MKKVFSLFIIIISFFMLFACGSGQQDSSSGTGGISAQVIWPSGSLSGKSGTVLEKAPAEVRWIRMIVSNGTTTITSSDFDTTLVNTGTLSGIPPGSDWTLTVQGLDNSTPRTALYQGARTNITVVVSQITNAGPVAMQVYAPSGTLDKSYNSSDNTESTNAPTITGNESANTLAIQADGKIVVAGQSNIRNVSANGTVVVARYNIDGSLDNSFADTDTYTNKISGVVSRNTISASWANDIVLQQDGKILIAGTIEATPSSYDFIAMRFNSNGSVDGTFSQASYSWFKPISAAPATWQPRWRSTTAKRLSPSPEHLMMACATALPLPCIARAPVH